jgi:hypothetical protein
MELYFNVTCPIMVLIKLRDYKTVARGVPMATQY